MKNALPEKFRKGVLCVCQMILLAPMYLVL